MKQSFLLKTNTLLGTFSNKQVNPGKPLLSATPASALHGGLATLHLVNVILPPVGSAQAHSPQKCPAPTTTTTTQ